MTGIRYRQSHLLDNTLLHVGLSKFRYVRAYVRTCVRAYVRTCVRAYVRTYVRVLACVYFCELPILGSVKRCKPLGEVRGGAARTKHILREITKLKLNLA